MLVLSLATPHSVGYLAHGMVWLTLRTRAHPLEVPAQTQADVRFLGAAKSHHSDSQDCDNHHIIELSLKGLVPCQGGCSFAPAPKGLV